MGNGFIGLKTGTTPGAGNCVALNYVNNKKNINVVIVLLNCPTNQDRWNDSTKLRDFIVQKLENGWKPES